MVEFPKPIEFEWDEGNIHKSYQKHGITPNQAEKVFADRYVLVLQIVKHSQTETRFVAIGRASRQLILFVVYTVRRDKIRIISARPAAKKERRFYEKAKKNTTV